MIVKHISNDGKVRRTFDGVSSMWQHDDNTIVTVNRSKPSQIDSATGRILVYSYKYPIAIINLAPGESVEREDEPARA